ncbi:hypothetical protein [Afifella pfennigii]|uniref:hypothetical protein n=1 Tax=Afifella pfennigii TaxID=209897 RepID=UPI0004789134|nr:hypothetical protein [Afifella pfennigii]
MWKAYASTFILTAAGLLAALLAFVLVIDPYGASPIGFSGERALMDVNQRYMYPQIVRRKVHDSLVLGTSTSRLLRPAELEETFGGSFANLAMNSARAFEQYRVFDLFERVNGPPRTLIVGLDVVWCADDADTHRITPRGFPEWLYGERLWPALFYHLNFKTVEIAGRHVGRWLGLERPRYDGDGFGDFTGGEANWSLEKARAHLWPDGRHPIRPVEPAFAADAAMRAAWRFPALSWLQDILGRAPGSTVILAFMPVHVAAQPVPGSREAAREGECKRRVAELAGRHGAAYVDLRVPSQMTRKDENYWDRLHWRLGVGDEIIAAMAAAAAESGAAALAGTQ